MLDLYQIAIILVGVIVYAVLSRRLEASIITLPMVFTLFGWLIGQGGIELVPMEAEHESIQLVAESTTVFDGEGFSSVVDPGTARVRFTSGALDGKTSNITAFSGKTFTVDALGSAPQDGVSFVHVASIEKEDGSNPLSGTDAFKAFQKDIGDRCNEPPAATELTAEVGSYGFFD